MTILELVEYQEVMKDNEWINALKEELEIIEKNDT